MTPISEIADRLAEQAEAVCRYYLSNGKRAGRYWSVGDVRNTPGQSMQVRLYPSPTGRAGKWNDFSSHEHGDLIDVIRLSLGLVDIKDVLAEARRFLALPPPTMTHPVLLTRNKSRYRHCPSASVDSKPAFQRLWRMSRPVRGTLAERYLHSRGIILDGDTPALRFHPHCFYRFHSGATQHLPAMIAAATDGSGNLTGITRTFLAANGDGKAAIEHPRKALGQLLGSSIRFGPFNSVQLAGEGIETVMTLHSLLPALTIHAAGSSSHLPAIPFDTTLRRLYIAHDNDAAGERSSERLLARAAQSGVETIVLMPQLSDFNDDLTAFGRDHINNRLRVMLHPDDCRHLKTG